MGSDIANYIQEHVKAATMLYELEGAIDETGRLIAHCCASGAKLLLCGNGGSAADAQHIAAELVGRFVAERKALPAIALTTDTSTLTAISNDYGFEKVFERQVNALAAAGDVVVGISTSGNSGNVIEAVKAAKANGCVTIGLLGGGGGQLAGMVDHPIVVPHQTTSYIQECHILIGHIWCAMVDADQTRDDR